MAELFWWSLALHLGAFGLLGSDLLLRRRKEPMATLSWLLGLGLVPGLGALLYVFFGSETIRRRKYRWRRRVLGSFGDRMASRGFALRRPLVGSPPQTLPPRAAEALAVAMSTSRRPPTQGNAIRVFDSVPLLYADLEAAIRTARDHIHLEFYIFQPDATGRKFLELLTGRAVQGIEVRLLLDAVGSRALGQAQLAPLLRAGGRVGWFLPIHKAFPWRLAVHLRNHRKIAVIDGETAYTGGANIGDEYRGRWARRVSWRDTHMKVQGPAVQQLQEVFAEDWSFAAGEELLDDRYFPPVGPAGDAIVHVVSSGPDDPTRALHATLFHAIATAEKRVWIATPYFVPDEAIATALMTSARRGVDVRVLLPERTDHPLVDRAAESFLPELVEAGVKAYWYEAGMLHSKLVTVDGEWGFLGSANMDIRSFRLNFEVNLLVLSPTWTRSLEAIFEKDLVQSTPITRSHLEVAPIHRRLTVALCRMLAPVL